MESIFMTQRESLLELIRQISKQMQFELSDYKRIEEISIEYRKLERIKESLEITSRLTKVSMEHGMKHLLRKYNDLYNELGLIQKPRKVIRLGTREDNDVFSE